MQIEQLKPIVEAALLAASQPLSVVQLCELFAEEDEVGRDDVARALEALAADCEGRGVELKEVASGFRYQVRQAVHPWVSRMWTEKPSRYSRALLETLALIAYRQPITRPEIEQIRGVVVSSNIIKTLEEREWIRVVGHRDVPGRPALFGTTRAFLDYFNLKSLDELPPLSEIREMEDPQLRLDEEPLPARVARDLPIDPDGDAADDAGAAATDDAAAATEAADAAAGTAQAGAGNDDGEAPSASEIEPDAAALAAAVDELAEANADPSAADPAAHDTDAAPAPEAGAEPDHPTADEAATPADADPGAAEQDTEEYRA
ncbi:SMC-Scp complex subunit ScpB [Fulvimonas soli]|uniref:Condensin subunit ScpB n=1 Tax=Fulvimonas soli TaxID=155197 RepID=A0A316I9Y8_9GAMM|nr:SMC-Scp complex subunit ScpB [Fulvimonas soli]PWK89885.1 condensin subunit ScpB [Fulvimonas soli]TNY27478.1 SMC-Scp complex subunit ScpB [Fulvimonas soli]